MALSTAPRLDPPATGPARKPGWRFLLSHPAHTVALGFGSGLSPLAPGTAGTAWAWLVFALAAPRPLTVGLGAAILVGGALVGWWASTLTARHLGVADPGAIVWDEILAFWLVLWLLTPASLATQACAFVLFRIFDAAKPGPVAWADGLYKARRGEPIGWRQGFAIMLDDLVAALCTLLVIALWRRLWI